MSDDTNETPSKPVPWDPCAIDWEEMDALRRESGEERILQSLRLRALTRELAIAGIRDRHPDLEDEAVKRMLAEQDEMLGRLDVDSSGI
jgi:hypothetical protein